MSMFGKISDEELAAYLEGKLSKKKSAMVNAAIDINTLEILRVSEKAIGEFPAKKKSYISIKQKSSLYSCT